MERGGKERGKRELLAGLSNKRGLIRGQVLLFYFGLWLSIALLLLGFALLVSFDLLLLPRCESRAISGAGVYFCQHVAKKGKEVYKIGNARRRTNKVRAVTQDANPNDAEGRIGAR